MKLIFLDVDGVLNRVQTKAQAPSGCTGIETELVKNLAKIVNETNALIILTSDWKVGWEAVSVCCSEDAKYLNEMLAKEGLQIVGKTYDDHVFGDFDEEIRKHLIKTNCFEGLSVEKAEQAIVIINNGADTDR